MNKCEMKKAEEQEKRLLTWKCMDEKTNKKQKQEEKNGKKN